MASPNRKGGGGLSLQTLAIASAASVTAAMVTSRLFPSGTIYASALTPVIVAAVNELLHRPADRVTALREERRTLVREARRVEAGRIRGGDPNPLRGAPEFAHGAAAEDDAAFQTGASNGHRADDPLAGLRVRGRQRRIHPKVWVATGLVAFAIAVAALTLPELLFGGAVASNHRTTFFGGGTHPSAKPQTKSGTKTAPAPSQSTTQTSATATQPTQTQTSPQTTTTQTAPSGGTPAPSGSQTTTTGGAAPPLP